MMVAINIYSRIGSLNFGPLRHTSSKAGVMISQKIKKEKDDRNSLL